MVRGQRHSLGRRRSQRFLRQTGSSNHWIREAGNEFLFFVDYLFLYIFLQNSSTERDLTCCLSNSIEIISEYIWFKTVLLFVFSKELYIFVDFKNDWDRNISTLKERLGYVENSFHWWESWSCCYLIGSCKTEKDLNLSTTGGSDRITRCLSHNMNSLN